LRRSVVVPIVFRFLGLTLLAAGIAWVFATRYEKPLAGAVGAENEMRLATAANQGRNFTETIQRTTRALGWAPLRWQIYFLRALGKIGARLPVNDAADDFRRARFLEPNVYQVPFEDGVDGLAGSVTPRRFPTSGCLPGDAYDSGRFEPPSLQGPRRIRHGPS
jgi:hypothetical protein